MLCALVQPIDEELRALDDNLRGVVSSSSMGCDSAIVHT